MATPSAPSSQGYAQQPQQNVPFRPVKHGYDFDDTIQAITSHPMQSCQEKWVKPVAPSTSGFTQVHVSGLPADVEDYAVEEKLRRVLHERRKMNATQDNVDAPAAKACLSADDVFARVMAMQQAEETEQVEKAPEAAAEDTSEALESQVAATDVAAETQVAADTDEAAAKEEPEEEVEADDSDVFVSCTVVRNKDTDVCKGYCFLAFATPKEAEAAIAILNDGVEVSGAEIKAQVSQPKEFKQKQGAHAPKEENLSDLRIRRKRYPGIGSRAAHGHFQQASGKLEGGESTHTRNSAGQLTSKFGGTRGGRDSKGLDETKCSTRSGFRA